MHDIVKIESNFRLFGLLGKNIVSKTSFNISWNVLEYGEDICQALKLECNEKGVHWQHL